MIGVFGGTFDPIHYGHLRTLWEVCEALSLKEIRLIPCHAPVHRGVPGALPEQRLAMLQLALQNIPSFVVDQRELHRGGRSYMVDTLASLRDELGPVPLCLILGMDAFIKLDTWHEWSRLIDLAHIVVMQRPGCATPSGPVAELVMRHRVNDKKHLMGAVAGGVWFQQVTQLEIAATAIRRLVAEERDIHFLLPDTVREYIKVNGLYR